MDQFIVRGEVDDSHDYDIMSKVIMDHIHGSEAPA